MGLVVFVTYVWERIKRSLMNGQDIGVALALYFVYPAILWLLIDKFHGICGPETYLQKAEAIAANNSVFIWYTALMRTHKIATIILFQADASDKQEDPGEVREEHHYPDEEGCTKLKCRVWYHLTQELVGIFCVSFLLIICLPVLAFWFMFVGIIVSSCNLYFLLKRLWRDAHSVAGEEIMDAGRYGEEGQDIEFQEFLSNFADDDNEESGSQ
mmetsp:Transcript_4023/g.6334  ORF Transcript_4023/g.6334 Transcript_4023/m.6334 type:complete len:213 (+) Transcript_4023:172-810(+)|eukprot:CAMPEP_0178826956 /NCGR_PEP_ID=MMETSP0746-20121128/7012_1 /TAXON_ID=913974 /ORGANISM="Nitzschia punctata, Strain CCMP561" /LENGTH=212 /DNA_ID=CAMNT_0020488783 /DNA_START=87 /DNA_END=725 /DNA_ORIENTATION=+